MSKTVNTLKKIMGICWDKQSDAYNKISDILQSQNIDTRVLSELVESTEEMCAVRAAIIEMGGM